MDFFISELEKRLKSLENEQNKQNKALNKMDDFEAEVNRLENTLAEIDNYDLKLKKPETDFSYLRDGNEIDRLEKQLAEIDKQPQQLTSTISTQIYIITLMFNPKSPIEWSGTGWQKSGKGMLYTAEKAKEVLKKLKKQWPNYPLKILRRSQ